MFVECVLCAGIVLYIFIYVSIPEHIITFELQSH